MDDLDCVVSPDCLTNIVLGLCYVEATTHELLSPEKGWPVVETCDLISTLVVKDDSVKFFVVEHFPALECLCLLLVDSLAVIVVVPIRLLLEEDRHHPGRDLDLYLG